MLKIGIIREGKQPQDSRVVLTPKQIRKALDKFDVEILVQPSPHRCFSDNEYKAENIKLQEDVSDCDILIGVKEVPIELLVPEKTYFFFSHTIKAQPYNQKLLQAILYKNIRLIDYECLTDARGVRIIAFGRWAGIVGAHNGLYTWGERTGDFKLKRAKDCKDFEALKLIYNPIELPPIKIAITGNGRVARGAIEMMKNAGIRKVTPTEFLNETFEEAVFVQLKCEHLYKKKNDESFSNADFYINPSAYESIFKPYTSKTDLFINAIYWDPNAPAYFSLADMKKENFRIKTIADITCDIAPEASVPSTIRPSTIAEPIYGFHPTLEKEVSAFDQDAVSVMAIDNLPNELPRDASESFGHLFLDKVMPELMQKESEILNKATIAKNGALTQYYSYLQDYADGK